MQENTIRFLVNREFLVIDVSKLTAYYDSFFIHEIIEKAGIERSLFDETELGDFDLQGKMNYFPTNLADLKMTYLDEKAILIISPEASEFFRKIMAPGIIHAEKMGETDDEDWFGEKLFYGQYGRSPIYLKAGLSEWSSPALLRTFLQKPTMNSNNIVSTGGCLFNELRDKKIIDLSRTPENHLFVEDEEHLLLGSGLSPHTAKHLLRNQYADLDAAFDSIAEPFNHSSSLWDICCFHASGKRLTEVLVSLKTIVTIHNGHEAQNVSPTLLNKLTPGLPLYFLIPKIK